MPAIAPRKRLAHALKAALYRCAALDAWLDDRLAPGGAVRRSVLGRSYLRLLPERAVRSSPFGASHAAPGRTVLVLTLVPPEDLGGGSRPAQLAAELHRRGWAVDWRYALPIFPWPAQRRPEQPHVKVRYVGSRPRREIPGSPALALLEAPHPALVDGLEQLPRTTRVVHDAIDVWDGALGAGWYDAAAEGRALARADVLLASSRLLRDELARRCGRDVALLPNAVDARLFDPATPRPVPGDLRRGAPTLVYVGSLWGEWIDLELVAQLARALPAASFNLIGPAGTRALPEAPNVAWLGVKPQRDVPAYLQAADVAIVPFAAGRLTEAVSPLKVFEYLAMERPVVSTPMAELAGVPGVTVAGDAETFAAAVRAASTRPFPREQAAAFVAAHTWRERVDRLLALAALDDGADRTGATGS